LVTGAIASSWSFTSWRRPTFFPILALGICPAISRTGDDAEYAVERPEDAFRRPGPGTTSATPMSPPARA
jgi:hypothetical protein